MSKKFRLLTLSGFVLIFGFLFFDTASAQQVRIDNFNVIQRIIPSTPSNLDFRLTVSQQDPNLDCSPLIPLTNGDLEGVVWYETSLTGPKIIVRTGSSGLPLSPNPLNLDFSISNFVPDSGAIQAGGADFLAAIGCTVYTNSANRGDNLAVSSPIHVSIGGGGGPGQTVSVSFNIPNPIQAQSLIDLAKAIGKFLLEIAIPIAVIVIIYAGLLYLTSGGSKEKVATAHKALWYAVIGLAIILIGQGFFVLIKSILDLGGPSP